MTTWFDSHVMGTKMCYKHNGFVSSLAPNWLESRSLSIPTSSALISKPKWRKMNFIQRVDPLNMQMSLNHVNFVSHPIKVFTSARSRQHYHPVRNAHVAILTDFSSDPIRAVRDRMSDPVFAGLLFMSAFIGSIVTLLFSVVHRAGTKKLTSTKTHSETPLSDGYETVNAGQPQDFWLNDIVGSYWQLMGKSINVAVSHTLQTALDRLSYPAYITKLTVKQFHCNSSSSSTPKLFNVCRIASRAERDCQLTFNLQHEGMAIDLNASIQIGIVDVDVPVRVTQLRIDQAKAWLSIFIEPTGGMGKFNPIAWGLLTQPSLSFDVRIGGVIPLSLIPKISNVLTTLITEQLPAQFLLPRATVLQQPEWNGQEWVKALFDQLDMDGRGTIPETDFINGLIRWGFASRSDQYALSELLPQPQALVADNQSTKKISYDDLIKEWQSFQDVFVSRRFRAIVSGRIIQATGLSAPIIGVAKPYVIVSIGAEQFRTKACDGVFEKEGLKGCANWNEVRFLNLFCF